MKIIRKILAAVFLIFIVIISVVPFLWVLSSSFKGNAEIMSSVVGYPNGLQLDNYVKAFEIAPLTTFYKNSILVAIIATILNLLIFSMAAYVLVRCRFRFKGLITMLFSAALVIPGAALLQPLYQTLNSAHLYDTLTGLIVVYVVEYAAVFNDGYLLDYVDVQSVGGNKVQREVYKAYEAAEQETEKYIYSELVMGSENVIFHIRRMRSDFERDVPLIIMVATNERDIASQYENLVQNEGEVVYLIDEENKVLSSNKEDEIGSYIDEKITECDTGEVYLNETYMMTSREVENLGKGVRLVHLYPQSLLIKKVLEGIRTYIILGVMLIIICLIAAVVISLKSTGFLNEFIHAMESVRNRNYDIRIKEYKNAEINSLGRAFNEMMDELRELIRNKYESQILLNEMEIRFLQHQMNPHFLFNVLLTIQIKAKRSGNETIYKMVSKLSALLRASIYTNNVDRITVGEELEYTEFYLYLQKMRFEDRFFYKIIVEDEELKKSIIPKFVIEPIVENAVIHGIENIENEGVIRIVLKKMGTDLLVTVQDNGAGFDVKEYFNSLEQAENGSSREKIGLKNVDLRLRHIYGEEYRIKIKSKINTGTTIYIKIPIEEREENV